MKISKYMRACTLIISALLCLTLCSCSLRSNQNNVKINSKKYNIAVISGGKDDEEFSSFCYGVSESFKNIGYKTDSFCANSNKAYLEEILSKSLEGGYVGVVLYDLNSYADEFIQRAREAGVYVAVFSSGIYENPEAVTVCYDQNQMTINSIDELVKYAAEDEYPGFNIVKIWHDAKDPVTSSRSASFDSYVSSKGINVSSVIYEEVLNTKNGLSRLVKNAVSQLPNEGFNYLWVCDDKMAKLIAEELQKESIHNAIIISTGITQSSLKSMQSLESYWYASSIISFKTSGQVCANVLSGCIENKSVQSITSIPAKMLYSKDLANENKNQILEELNI